MKEKLEAISKMSKEKIAEIKGITLGEVIDTTYNNAVKFYNLPG